MRCQHLRRAVPDRRTVCSVRRPTRGLAPEAMAGLRRDRFAGEAVEPRERRHRIIAGRPLSGPGAACGPPEARSFTPTPELGRLQASTGPASPSTGSVPLRPGVVVSDPRRRADDGGHLLSAIATCPAGRWPGRGGGRATGAPTVEPDAPGSKVASDFRPAIRPLADEVSARSAFLDLCNEIDSNQWLVILASSGIRRRMFRRSPRRCALCPTAAT